MSPTIYDNGKIIIVAGKTKPKTFISFTDAIFAVIRHVIKMAVTIRNH
jgi:hypothetical protein